MYWYFGIAIAVAVSTLATMPRARWYLANRPFRGVCVIVLSGLIWPLSVALLLLGLILAIVATIRGNR